MAKTLCTRCLKRMAISEICGRCRQTVGRYKTYASPWVNKEVAYDIVGQKKQKDITKKT